jgi:hypothetical protein
VFGIGAAATDAQHVAVEFVHPVIVGKSGAARESVAFLLDGCHCLTVRHGKAPFGLSQWPVIPVTSWVLAEFL